MPLYPIVDENDVVISYSDRKNIQRDDIYHVAVLWVESPQGNILLAKRALAKKHDPGKWGPAVAGTVEKGESYYENIVREAEEELGLKNISPIAAKKYFNRAEHTFFSQWFTLTIPESQDFVLQEEEVSEVRWFAKNELKELIRTHPEEFLPSASRWLPFLD